MNTAMERMSSGSKINSAKDDAAGLAVSTQLETTVSSSKVATANVKLGSNLLDTSEGTLSGILKNLQRIRDLTTQSSNGTYSTADLTGIATEVSQRTSEIDRSAKAATFNGINLFDSKTSGTNGVKLQIGTTATDSLTLDKSLFKDATVSTLGLFSVANADGVSGSGITKGDISVKDASGNSVALLDAKGNHFNVTDTSGKLDMTAAITAMFSGTATTNTGTVKTPVLTSYNIAGFLNNADDAIANVTDRDTKIGAYQNRLTSITSSLSVQQTNLTAANSTIKDADIASESAAYVQAQILQNASATLLVQANSAPQIALTLIKG
jgi:flagellin